MNFGSLVNLNDVARPILPEDTCEERVVVSCGSPIWPARHASLSITSFKWQSKALSSALSGPWMSLASWSSGMSMWADVGMAESVTPCTAVYIIPPIIIIIIIISYYYYFVIIITTVAIEFDHRQFNIDWPSRNVHTDWPWNVHTDWPWNVHTDWTGNAHILLNTCIHTHWPKGAHTSWLMKIYAPLDWPRNTPNDRHIQS